MKLRIVGFLFLSLSLWAGATFAAQGDWVESVGNGAINWSKGIILAKGSGAPPKEAKNIAQARLMAERAALTDARRNLLEVLKGVRVDSATHVENYMVKSDQIRLRAEGFIQGSVERKELRRYLSDGAIEVTVAMNLNGDFLALMLTPAQEAKMARPSIPAKPAPEAPAPLLPKKTETSTEKPKVQQRPVPTVEKPKVEERPIPVLKPLPTPADLPKFTGLVIDVRGLKVRAALIPRIMDEKGEELYQGQYVTGDKAAQNGLALYSKDLTAAQTNPRVGRNPLTVKGLKVNPVNPSDIFLTPEDAKKVAPFTQKGTFLEECKVMIVLD